MKPNTFKRTVGVQRNVICHCSSIRRDTEALRKSLQLARLNAVMLYNLVPTSNVCKEAWDKVWDLEKAYYKRKEEKFDPLIEYCEENPDADECRIYDV